MKSSHFRSACSALVCGVFAAACAAPGAVEGEIDGVAVPALASAIFARTPALNGADGEQLSIEAFTFADACTLHAEAFAIEDEADLVAFHEARLPADYWQISVSFTGNDVAALVDTKVELGDAAASVTITHVKAHPTLNDDNLLELDQVRAGSTDGSLKLASLSESGASVDGNAELEFLADGPGGLKGDAGEVSVLLNASACQPLDDALVARFDLE